MSERTETRAEWNEARWFVTTRWSTIMATRGNPSSQATDALEVLCRQYWPPVYAFIRRRGHGPDHAQDLTQEFFARLLEKDYLRAADPAKGRFRTLLLTAVTRFLVNEWERSNTQKRGAGAIHLSVEADLLEQGHRFEPTDRATPETIFERRWAETLLESVLGRLRREMETAGQHDRFDILKPFLVTENTLPGGAEVALRLGISESAVYSAVHRLRHRYGQLLREEIAHTVASPGEIEEELRYLAQVLSR